MGGCIKEGGWMDAISRSGWMDALNRGGWMHALSGVVEWMR